MPSRPQMVRMDIPQLAQVIVSGNERGQKAAQFLLHEKLRLAKGDLLILNAVDEQGCTAADNLAASDTVLAFESLCRLLMAGATPPKDLARALRRGAAREQNAYMLIHCFQTCEDKRLAVFPEDQGNPLHILALEKGVLTKLEAQITDKNSTFMHGLQPAFFAWLGQARSCDGATPLHMSFRATFVRDKYNPNSPSDPDPLATCGLAQSFVCRGGRLNMVDADGVSLAQLFRENVKLLPPHLLEPTRTVSWIRPEVFSELERCEMELATPETAKPSPQRRL